MSDFDWREFLQGWSRELFGSDDLRAELPPEVIASGWLGYAGASEADIVRAEARLGQTLPPSYREFLRTSNGWRQTGLFIDKLWSTEEVDWFRMRHQKDWIDAWTMGSGYYGTPEPVPDAEYFVYGKKQRPESLRVEYLETALEISAEGDACVYLLNPQVVTREGEWEAWFLASWLPGASRYRSFQKMMQAERKNFMDLKRQEEKRLVLRDAPEMIGVKLPRLIEELTRQRSHLRSGPTELYDRGVRQGLEFALNRVRELQRQTRDPKELHAQLQALAAELDQKWQEETQAGREKYGTAALFSMDLAQLWEGIYQLSVPEGYREAAGIIRWFLNER